MREHSYNKFSPAHADAVDLQSLLDQLADFLLQSGFAGGGPPSPWGDPMEDGADRSLDALRQAILQALMDSGQFTPEMLDALRGDGDDEGESAARLAKLLDEIIQRLVSEGFLNMQAPPQVPSGHQQVTGAGGLAHAASRDVQFQLTEKGIDFLGFKTLRVAPRLARKIDVRQSRHTVSRHRHRVRRVEQAVRVRRHDEPRRRGDAAERARAHGLARHPARPRLRRSDGAPGRVPLELRHRAHARHLALDDPVRRGPLHAGEEGRARAHASHPHAVPRRHAARGALPRFGGGDPARAARARASRTVPHEHRRGSQARAAHPARAEEGHAADRDDHRRQAERADDAQRA